MTTLLLPPIVAAGVVTDSLGREWDPLEHPRGRDGKFIRTFHMIRAFLNIGDSEPWMTGEVQSINSDGSVRVLVNKTVDPALKDPTSGQLYVGHTVDVTPDRVESINEKATIKLGPDGKPEVATKGFDKYDFSQESLTNFSVRAGLSQFDADDAVKAAQRYKNGEGEPFTTRDRYTLALYAKSVSGDGRERSHEDFTNLLDELGVPGDVTDDTPDGLSGLAYLGDQVNNGRSPNINQKDSSEWLKEAPPMHEGTVREAVHKDDANIRLAWFDDGTQGFINTDGSVEKYNPTNNDGKSITLMSHERMGESNNGFAPPGSNYTFQPSNIPGAKFGEEAKQAMQEAKGSNLDADGNRINPLLDDDGNSIQIKDGNQDWLDIGDKLERSGPEYDEKEQAALDNYHVGLSSKANGGGAVWDSMNRALRDDTPMSDSETEMYDGLASAASRTRTSEDLNLYRGMHWGNDETLPSELFDQLHEGGVINSKAFTSASESKATASNFMSNPDDYEDVPQHAVLMEIEVPKGTPAVLGDKNQHEYVLPPNSRMEVVSVTTEQGFNGAPETVARLRVVDDTAPESPPGAPDLKPEPKAKVKAKKPPEPEELEGDDFDVPEPEGPSDSDLEEIQADDAIINEFDRDGIDTVVSKLRRQQHDDAEDQAAAIEAIANNYEEGNISEEEAYAQINEISWEVYHQGEDDENEDLKQLSIDLDAAFPDPNAGEELGAPGENDDEPVATLPGDDEADIDEILSEEQQWYDDHPGEAEPVWSPGDDEDAPVEDEMEFKSTLNENKEYALAIPAQLLDFDDAEAFRHARNEVGLKVPNLEASDDVSQTYYLKGDGASINAFLEHHAYEPFDPADHLYNEQDVSKKPFYGQPTTGLTWSEQASLDSYVEESETLNDLLRQGGELDTGEDSYEYMSKDLDSIIEKSPEVPAGTVLYRGLQPPSGDDYKYKNFIASLVPGAVVSDKAFVSTSYRPESANDFFDEDGVVFHITVGDGVKGIDVDATREHHFESELILPRDTEFTVTNVQKDDDGNTIVSATIGKVVSDDGQADGPEAGEADAVDAGPGDGDTAPEAEAPTGGEEDGDTEAAEYSELVDTPKKFQVLDDPGASGDGYYATDDGSKLWGKYGAAGVLVRNVDDDGTERFLMVQRGTWVSTNVGKWQLPGGALNSNENDYQGTARELNEELVSPDGWLDNLHVTGEVNFEHKSGWHYNNIAADHPEMFEPTPDGQETGDAKWVTREELAQLELHPALAKNLDEILGKFPAPEKKIPLEIPDTDETEPAPDFSTNFSKKDLVDSIIAKIEEARGEKLDDAVKANIHGMYEENNVTAIQQDAATHHAMTPEQINANWGGAIDDMQKSIASMNPNYEPGAVVPGFDNDEKYGPDPTPEDGSNEASAWAIEMEKRTKPVSEDKKTILGMKVSDYFNAVAGIEDEDFMAERLRLGADDLEKQGAPVLAGKMRKWADAVDGTSTGTPDAPGYVGKPTPSLTDDEKNAVIDYVEDSEDLNGLLRDNDGYVTGTAEKWAKDLDSAIAKSPDIPEGTKVYRAFAPDSPGDNSPEYQAFLNSLQPGAEVRDYGFMSTAVERDQTNEFLNTYGSKDDEILLEITVGKGVKGFDVNANDLDNENLGTQGEILFPRDMKVTITDRKKDENGTTIVSATIGEVDSTDGTGPETDVPNDVQTFPGEGDTSTGGDNGPGVVDVIDTSDWTKVGGQGGSNLGGTYESPNGNRYYVKKGKTPDHARNEALAASLYDAAGVASAQQLLADTPWGGLGTASPEIPGAKQDLNAHLNDEDYLDKLRDGFAVDAWLANWDVAGLVMDNVVTDENGNPVRVDPGGALFFRAMGSPKAHLFTDTVSEIDTLRNSGMNPQSSKIFGGMSEDEMRLSAQHVMNISPELIDQLVDSVGFGDGIIDPEEMKAKLKKRREFIADRFGLELPENGTPDIGVPDDAPEPDVDTTPEPQYEDPFAPGYVAPSKPDITSTQVTSDTFEPTATYQVEVDGKELTKDLQPDEDINEILANYGVHVADQESEAPDPEVGFEGYSTYLLEGQGKDLKSVWNNLQRPDDEFYQSIVKTGDAVPEGTPNTSAPVMPTPGGDGPLADWEKELLGLTDDAPELPGPDSDEWDKMIDDKGPYRWNGSGQKLYVGDEVTGAKGLVGKIHKFENNNKGVVVKDAAGKSYARHRATLELTNPPDDFPDVTTPEPDPALPTKSVDDVYDTPQVKDAVDDFLHAAAQGNLEPGDKVEFGSNKLYLEYKPDGYDPDYPITLFNPDGADLNSYSYGVNPGAVVDEIQDFHETYVPAPAVEEQQKQFTMPWHPGMNDMQNMNFFVKGIEQGNYPAGSRMEFPDGHTLTHMPEYNVYRYEFIDPDDGVSTNFGDFYTSSPTLLNDVMAFRAQHKGDIPTPTPDPWEITPTLPNYKTPDWFDLPAGHTPYMWSEEQNLQSIITRDEADQLWRFNGAFPEDPIWLGNYTDDDTDWTNYGWIAYSEQPDGPVNKSKPTPKAPDTDTDTSTGKQLGDAPDLSDYNDVVNAIGGMINKQWNTGLEDGDFVKLGSRFKLYYDEDDDRVKLIANDNTEVIDYLPGDLHQQGIEDEIHNAMLDYNKKFKPAELPDLPDEGNIGQTNAFNEPGDAQDHVQIIQNQYNSGNLDDMDSLDLGDGWALQYHASSDGLKLWHNGTVVKQYEHENTFGNPDFPKSVLKDMGINLDAAPTYDSVAELAKINDIPKKMPDVKKLFDFGGPPMTDYEATQYRNAGYALDDAAKELVDSPEWNNAVNKAIWNLNHAGNNGKPKLAEVTKWRTDTLNAKHGGVIDAAPESVLGEGYADLPEGSFPVFKYVGTAPASQGSVVVQDSNGGLHFYSPSGSVNSSILDKNAFENSLWAPYTPADATEAKKPHLPDGYAEVPDGYKPGFIFHTQGEDPVYALIPDNDQMPIKFAYKTGMNWDSTSTVELLKNSPAWKPYGGHEVTVAPGVGDVPGPDLSKPHRIGSDGKPIFIGDEVIAAKDGKKYIVKSFQNNDKGVVVMDPVTKKKHALARTKIKSTNPANKSTQATNKSAATLPDSGVKVKQVEPDPSSPWFGKDKPPAPEPPEAISDDFKVVGDDWLEKANENYKLRMKTKDPNWVEKELSQSSTYSEYLAVQTGSKANLMSLLAKGRITQELHDEAMAKIEPHLENVKGAQEKHLAEMDQWRDDIRAWRKANGYPTIELKGMKGDGVVELDNQAAYDYFNKNYQAPGMSSAGKSAVISQKGSNISYGLRQAKEKTLDPDWMANHASYDVLNMDKAMLEAPPVKEDFITIRTFEKDAFINPATGSKYLHSEQLSNIVGSIQHDWGFAETSPGSLDAGATPGYEMNGVTMQLRVPAGTRGVWTLAVTNSHSGERGFILERGIAYYIHSAVYKNGQWYVDAELIPKDVNYDEFGHFVNQNPFFD